jgi:sister-chromatid-cohesion protein PDS5
MHFISQKLWAVCDLAMGLVLSKTTNYEMKEFPADTRVPTMYFRRHEDALWVNAKSYLPPEMQVRLITSSVFSTCLKKEQESYIPF